MKVVKNKDREGFRPSQRGRGRKEDTAKKFRRVVVKGWDVVRRRLCNKNPLLLEEEFCIYLEDVPKLIRKMTPSFFYRHVDFVKGKYADMFYLVGMTNIITKYTVGDNGRYVLTKTHSFPYPLHLVKFVKEGNLFVGFNMDRMLVVMSVVRGEPKELCRVEQLFHARCLCVIPETAQLVVGGVGFLRVYSLTAFKSFATQQDQSMLQGMNIDNCIAKEDWVVDIIVYEFNHSLVVVIDSGILLINYIEWRVTYKLTDPDGGAFTCCCIDGTNSFLITGSRYGFVKVWSIAIKVMHHHFMGHRDSVSAIACHHKEPIVVTGSQDGCVFIWRLDTFRKFKQILVSSSPVTRVNMSSHQDMDTVGFWCQTEFHFYFYELAEPYRIFAAMDSSVVRLKRLLGHEKYPNRILVATWDGGVWFKNPITAETVGFMFPIITLKNVDKYAYDVVRQRLYILLPTGGVLVLKCSKTPFRAIEHMAAESSDETITSLVEVMLWIGTDEYSIDTVVILIGLTNGQIDLMESDNLHMNCPLQAHHGSVQCLQPLTEVLPADPQGAQKEGAEGEIKPQETYATSHRVVLSAGSDMCVKMWRLRLGAREGVGFELIFLILMEIRLNKVPKYIASGFDRVAVLFTGDTTLEMYDVSGVAHDSPCDVQRRRSAVITHDQCLTHDPDFDHTDTVTALDRCPLLNIFATSSMDKTVKIWDDSNILIRELVFEEPVVDICFVTDIGDLLIARDFVLVYSSPEYYLPWSYLEEMLGKNFMTERLEAPRDVVDSDRAWVDPNRVPRIKRRVPLGSLCKKGGGRMKEGSGELEEWQLTWRDRTSGMGDLSTIHVKVHVKRPKVHKHKSQDAMLQISEDNRPHLALSVSILEEQERKLVRKTCEKPGVIIPSMSSQHVVPPASIRQPSRRRSMPPEVGVATLRPEDSLSSRPSSSMARCRSSVSITAVEESEHIEGVREGQRSGSLVPHASDQLLDNILDISAEGSSSSRRNLVKLNVRKMTIGRSRASINELPPKVDKGNKKISVSDGETGAKSPPAIKFDQMQLTTKRTQSDTELQSLSLTDTDLDTQKLQRQETSTQSMQMGSCMNLLRALAPAKAALSDSQVAIHMDKAFRHYCQQPGCGPLGPLMGLSSLSRISSPSTSYADSDEIAWHRRCLRMPEIPNSVILKEKKHRPTSFPTFHQRLHWKVIDFLQKMELSRPPLFHKKKVTRLVTPVVATTDVVGKKPKEIVKVGRRRRCRRVKYVKWETLEEFAVIRRRMLPVFSTRLFPWPQTPTLSVPAGGDTFHTVSQAPSCQPSPELLPVISDGGLTVRGSVQLLKEPVTPDTRDERRRRTLEQVQRQASTLGQVQRQASTIRSMSSSDVIMHTSMLQCMTESWFPPDVERKPIPIFRTLLTMMSPLKQVDVLLEICSYVGILCHEANLPDKQKAYAAYKTLTLCSTHDNPRVRAACAKILPLISPLNKPIAMILSDSLANENDELKKAAYEALIKYGIRSSQSLARILNQFDLHTPDFQDEVSALSIAKGKLQSDQVDRHNKQQLLAHYKAVFNAVSSRFGKKVTKGNMLEDVHLSPIATMKQARPEIRIPVLLGDPTADQVPIKPFSRPPSRTIKTHRPTRKHLDTLGYAEVADQDGGARAPPTSPLSVFSDSSLPSPVNMHSQSAPPCKQKSLKQAEHLHDQRWPPNVQEEDWKEEAAIAIAEAKAQSTMFGLSKVKDKSQDKVKQKPQNVCRLSRLNKVVDSYFKPIKVQRSDSRSSLHFISSDDDSDGDLSDSSFVYQLPERPRAAGAKRAISSRSPHRGKGKGLQKTAVSKARHKAVPAATVKKGTASRSASPPQKTATSTSLKSLRTPKIPNTRGCYWTPGEPGLRVHHRTLAHLASTPRAPHPSGVIAPLTGRMGMDMITKQSGQTQYGALSLEWTTRVPILPIDGVTRKLRKLQRGVWTGNIRASDLQQSREDQSHWINPQAGSVRVRGARAGAGAAAGAAGGTADGAGVHGGDGGGRSSSQSLPFPTSLLIACIPPVPRPLRKPVDVSSPRRFRNVLPLPSPAMK